MYRLKEIQNSLLHLVGWEQSINPSNEIDSDLTQTESGLFFQMAHPLMTLNNVESIMPDDWNMQYSVWDQNKSYLKGDKVKNLNVVYVALQNNSGSEPTISNPDWKVYNMLSDYLKRITINGISTMVQNFIQIKQLNDETKSLLERTLFFDGSGRKANTVSNNGRLVGFEIDSVRSMGVTSKIERIGLQMIGTPGTVKLYLFHSSKVDPIKTVDIEVSGSGSFEWFMLEDFYLPNVSADVAGGSYYLVYNQDELPIGLSSINTSKDWSNEPCGGCNVGDAKTWRELTKYIRVSPFMVKAPTTFKDFPEMWSENDMMYTNTQNYGLNAEVTVGCDLTDFIITQRDIFKTVLQKQVTAIALRTMAMNPDVRVNRNQSNASKMDILYELDGNTSGVRPGGLGYELKKAYEALSLDTEKLDKYCLSCNNRGIKFSTV